MKRYINNIDDIMDFLDTQVQNVAWDSFYELRERPVPFIIHNELPDENLVGFIDKGLQIKSVIEFGCGEGRNAIYMAKRGLAVTAFDVSSVAIENARIIAKKKGLHVDFRCQNALSANINDKYDFAYDSGMLHHLSPHRRLTYIDLLDSVLKPNGYYGLVCFSMEDNCGNEVDDWEFYQKGAPGGVGFTKERLTDLFTPYFNVVEIRKYNDGIDNTMQGVGSFLWVCLFQKANHK